MARRKQNNPDNSNSLEESKSKKPRRTYGRGSVYWREDRQRWGADLTLPNGKRKTFYGKTKSEATEKLERAKLDLRQGIHATGSHETVGQYMERWLENIYRLRLIRESTYLTYWERLRAQILPSLGHIKLTKLLPEQLEDFYAKKLQEGLAIRTIQNLHSLIRKALSDAVRRNLIARNPCSLIELPSAPKYEPQALTTEQAQVLISAVKHHWLRIPILMEIITGMRSGEILGLKWQDINFEVEILHINRTLHYKAKRGYFEGPPKTKSSERIIPLPSLLIEVLQSHRARQHEKCLQQGISWEDRDLVFCNRRGGYLNITNVRVEFQTLCRKAGLPRLRPHDLRHSAATILAALGIHPRVVQDLLGHSKVEMTMNVYTKSLLSERKKALEKISDLFREIDQ